MRRLNFYDFFGHLLPGVVLCAGLWFPTALVLGWRTAPSSFSLLVVVILAYGVGHLAQFFGSAIQSSYGSGGRISETALRAAVDQRLSAMGLSALVRRQRTLGLCRSFLMDRRRVSYFEDFRGATAFARGVMTTAILLCAYHFGWFIGRYYSWPADATERFGLSLAIAALGIVLLLLVPQTRPRSTPTVLNDLVLYEHEREDLREASRDRMRRFQAFWALVGFFLFVGLEASRKSPIEEWMGSMLTVLILVELLAAVAFKRVSEFYNNRFVEAVTQDFLVSGFGDFDRERSPT